ncbi:hypothetical protein K491DRAFT_697389 [Lophiostoma macrostomum CBS 122681]|uniref:Uncharacterized protein n=1 Tax=Lophiostoma macrostomum CBS 122681 TaxID=1314788 RepID=A0A6A6SS10_9PLEO|nr:hypothetical protein K491DRAFT_697389 [Lophiostoma macrostomum CBS 122681]
MWFVSASDAIKLCRDLECKVIASAIAAWAKDVKYGELSGRVNGGICFQYVSRETLLIFTTSRSNAMVVNCRLFWSAARRKTRIGMRKMRRKEPLL